MIASGAVPAPLPAHIGVSQTSSITAQSDFAGALIITLISVDSSAADNNP